MLENLTHFDPINFIVLVGGFIWAWFTLIRDSRWHSNWIKKHSAESEEQRKLNTEILTELQTTNARMVTVVEGHEKRIDRLESQVDRNR